MNKKEQERMEKQAARLAKERERLEAMSVYEKQYASCLAICGIDEVGRGPLAGPVVATAGILPEEALWPARWGLEP